MGSKGQGMGGFTLVELLVVISIMAIALGAASMSLRDPAQDLLQREAQRLTAQLEAARAQSRASGVQVRWLAGVGGYRFEGLWKPDSLLLGPGSTASTTSSDMGAGTQDSEHQDPTSTLSAGTSKIGIAWLDSATKAQPDVLLLGPEPLLPKQAVVLSNQGQQIRIGSDGIGPFAIQDLTSEPTRAAN